MDPHDRRGLRRGELPVATTRTTTRPSPPATPGASSTRSISTVYEPGSVFKMLTAAAGFSSGTITPTTPHQRHGLPEARRRHGRDLRRRPARHGHARLRRTAWPTRATSAPRGSRSALGRARRTQASAILYATWAGLGFGQPTGIDVAGEVPGLVHDPAITPWRQIDLANALLRPGRRRHPDPARDRLRAMVNGGHLVTPHVVAAVGDQPVAVPTGAPVISRADVGPADATS